MRISQQIRVYLNVNIMTKGKQLTLSDKIC